MGQYYTPVIMKDDKISTFLCYDYGNGAKLMEHSYIGNSFTETVLKQLLNKPARLAWVGDYAEPEDVENELAEKFIKIENNDEPYRKKPKKVGAMENSAMLVFINHSKKEYIDITYYILKNGADRYGCIIHPIPLLTAIGNGKGGGDYRGKNEDIVGRWACDVIEARTWIDTTKYKDYKEIYPEFNEG